MKEYFFLKGKDQNGPFTIEQLIDKELTSETLIWTEGMVDWQKLKDIPELIEVVKPKLAPPPAPDDSEGKISRTEVSGKLQVTTEKSPNSTLDSIKPSKSTLTWLIVWCGFHLFALLMANSEIRIFNNAGKPHSDKFWPFVDFQSKKYGAFYPELLQRELKKGKTYQQLIDEKEFDGFFVDYDWTEFAFYVGGMIVIFLIIQISNKSEEAKI
jgi:hypothetical protein